MVAAGVVSGLALMTGCTGTKSEPLVIVAPTPLPQAAIACTQLIDALPTKVDDGVNKIALSDSPLVAVWGNPKDPVIVRCGVAIPKAYSAEAILTVADYGTGPVGWFPETLKNGTTVLTSVRRPQKVEVTIPARYRNDVVLGNISEVVAKVLARGADTDEP